MPEPESPPPATSRPWAAGERLPSRVRLGGWEFWLHQQPWGTFVSVPDRGGMMDMLPRVPEQLAWAEAHFPEVPALERVWDTSWRVPPSALPDLEAFFRRHGASW